MSLAIPLERLQQATAEHDGGYVLTVTGDGRPHAVYVTPVWEQNVLVVEVGARSAANVAVHPAVSLLYPPREAGGYSLMVDGAATVAPGEGKRAVRITPSKAVRHRPAAVPDPTRACPEDCVPILGGRATR